MTVPFQDNDQLQEFCTPFIRGEKVPASAEELMASRYIAYTMAEVDYIVDTHHPDTREEVDRDSTEQWAKSAKWLGLEIVDHVVDAEDPDTAQVEFIARYEVEGAEAAHHERSVFKRVEGRWYFLDGDMVKAKPVVRETPKVGRNEPCPCSSGKKYKKCCGVA